MKQFMGRSETVALEWFARAVSLVAVVAAVAVPVNQLTQPGATVEILRTVDGATLAPGVFYEAATVPVTLRIAELPWPLRLASEAGFALSWLAIALGALMVARVLGAILGGDPFDPRNPRRIAVVAGCVLVGGTLAPLVQAEATMVVVDRLDHVGGADFAVPFELLPFLVAALIFVVAGVFHRGRELAQETEGLI